MMYAVLDLLQTIICSSFLGIVRMVLMVTSSALPGAKLIKWLIFFFPGMSFFWGVFVHVFVHGWISRRTFFVFFLPTWISSWEAVFFFMENSAPVYAFGCLGIPDTNCSVGAARGNLPSILDPRDIVDVTRVTWSIINIQSLKKKKKKVMGQLTTAQEITHARREKKKRCQSLQIKVHGSTDQGDPRGKEKEKKRHVPRKILRVFPDFRPCTLTVAS